MVPRLFFPIMMIGLIILSSCAPLVGTLDFSIDNSGAAVQTQAAATESPAVYPGPVETEPGEQVPTGPATGSASGAVCYPSEMIPPMNAFF